MLATAQPSGQIDDKQPIYLSGLGLDAGKVAGSHLTLAEVSLRRAIAQVGQQQQFPWTNLHF